jgi:hypothetical protein
LKNTVGLDLTTGTIFTKENSEFESLNIPSHLIQEEWRKFNNTILPERHEMRMMAEGGGPSRSRSGSKFDATHNADCKLNLTSLVF